MYNGTSRRVRVKFLPWKNSKYYLFMCVCVCVCERERERERERASVRECLHVGAPVREHVLAYACL
jgi:hypothetical protein